MHSWWLKASTVLYSVKAQSLPRTKTIQTELCHRNNERIKMGPSGHPSTEGCQEFLFVYLLSRSITTAQFSTCLRSQDASICKENSITIRSLYKYIYFFLGKFMESQKDIALRQWCCFFALQKSLTTWRMLKRMWWLDCIQNLIGTN